MVLRCSRTAALLAAGACVLSVGGCRVAANARQPNVLLIVVDALRADHLGAYGYPRGTSPSFDALAAHSTLFTRAYSTASWTNPAVASLFTGELPRVLQPDAPEFIAPEVMTLAQAFQSSGYRTGAIVGNPFLTPQQGFGQGFADYTPVSPWARGLGEVNKRPAEQVNALALQWLQAGVTDVRPWFLYLHYMDTHWPYEPPSETARRLWRSDETDIASIITPLNRKLRGPASDVSPAEVRQSVDLYDAAIAHFDAALGMLLETLQGNGQLATTWIAVTADHGEEFGEHGGFRHARTLYEEVIHVPLLIVPPASQGSVRIDRAVQLTDVGRTLLDAAGARPGTFAGRSLNGPETTDSTLLVQLPPSVGVVHQYALLHGLTKLIVAPDGGKLLFNLADDPAEQRSLASQRGELVEQLNARLAQALQLRGQPTASAAADPAVRERMRALGYDF